VTRAREERINALAVAVRVIDGTAGGYSPREISSAKHTLTAMLLDEQDALLKETDDAGKAH
jgi:hypothetical protein